MNCTGNCFTTAFYIDLIKEALKDIVQTENRISEANIVEDELQKITQSKKKHEHCYRCYENAERALWFAYQQLQ